MNEKRAGELLKALMIASKDRNLLQSFLEDLLTKRELAVLPKRWEIVRRLYKGESQWSIANDLKIGIATVTRGSRELKNPKGGFMQIIKKINNK